jgi:NADPH:quinone reductase-like Zn-dependent oxidoreductase
MPRAVRFSRYGGPEVLEIAQVDRPRAGRGQVVVDVVATALNPGEIGIREGVFAAIWPARFPEGQGNDFAGRVAEAGDGVTGFAAGDEVLGFAPRAAQADFVVARPGEGEITIPIAAGYPLERVRDAYRDLATRHVSGKRVLAVKTLSGFEGDN